MGHFPATTSAASPASATERSPTVDTDGRRSAPPLARGPFGALRRELARAWTRLLGGRLRRRLAGEKGLVVVIGPRLDVGVQGCAALGLDGAPGIDHVFDFRKRLPLPDGAARAIVCGDAFEAIDYTEELPFFLAECRRVLAPGGALRIRCRDAERFVRAYCDDDRRGIAALRRLLAGDGVPIVGRTRMEIVNAALRGHGCSSALYDEATLVFLLGKYGFREARRIDDPGGCADTITVEAIR